VIGGKPFGLGVFRGKKCISAYIVAHCRGNFQCLAAPAAWVGDTTTTMMWIAGLWLRSRCSMLRTVAGGSRGHFFFAVWAAAAPSNQVAIGAPDPSAKRPPLVVWTGIRGPSIVLFHSILLAPPLSQSWSNGRLFFPLLADRFPVHGSAPVWAALPVVRRRCDGAVRGLLRARRREKAASSLLSDLVTHGAR